MATLCLNNVASFVEEDQSCLSFSFFSILWTLSRAILPARDSSGPLVGLSLQEAFWSFFVLELPRAKQLSEHFAIRTSGRNQEVIILVDKEFEMLNLVLG